MDAFPGIDLRSHQRIYDSLISISIRVSGQFIGTTSSSGTGNSRGGTTSFGTFLFLTTGSGVRVATDNLDLLRRL